MKEHYRDIEKAIADLKRIADLKSAPAEDRQFYQSITIRMPLTPEQLRKIRERNKRIQTPVKLAPDAQRALDEEKRSKARALEQIKIKNEQITEQIKIRIQAFKAKEEAKAFQTSPQARAFDEIKARNNRVQPKAIQPSAQLLAAQPSVQLLAAQQRAQNPALKNKASRAYKALVRVLTTPSNKKPDLSLEQSSLYLPRTPYYTEEQKLAIAKALKL